MIESIVAFTDSVLIHTVYSQYTITKSATEDSSEFRTDHVMVPNRFALKTSRRIFLSRSGIPVLLRSWRGIARIRRSIGTLKAIHTAEISLGRCSRPDNTYTSEIYRS